MHSPIALLRHLGWWRSSVLIVLVLGYIFGLAALDLWLSARTGWREAYGFSCHGRCIVEDLHYSARLLVQHTPCEIAQFVLIWHLPVIAILATGAMVIHAVRTVLRRRRSTQRRARILPME